MSRERRRNDHETLSSRHEQRPSDAARSELPGGAAVVGASGFVGAALVRGLMTRGVPVRSFTRDVSFLTEAGGVAPEILRSETVFWLLSSVNPAVAEERPDLVEYDRAKFDALLRHVEDAVEPPRIVMLSSGGTVYDPTFDPPYREDSPVTGSTAYSRVKLDLEHALLASAMPDRCKVVVRAANVYGPGQPARRGQGVIAYWLRAAHRGEPLVLIGDPGTARDYIYIDDLVEALARLHSHADGVPPILNLGSGRGTTLEELADTVLSVVRDDSIALEVQPPRSFDRPSTWLAIDLAEQALGWKPTTSLRDGVASAWEHVAASTQV